MQYLIKPFEAKVLRDRLIEYWQQRQDLLQIESPDQAAVDRVFGTESAPAPLPKGLSAQTAELVRAVLREAEGLSATECAELTGVSRVSARRYLEYFVQQSRAEVTLRYGTAGRPERRYHWR